MKNIGNKKFTKIMNKKHLTKELKIENVFSRHPCAPQFPLCTPVPKIVPPVHPRSKRGFSLLELIIVIAIIAILGAAGVGYYRGFVKEVELRSASKALASDLAHMRSKAMIGEDSVKWGMHLVNTSGGDQYYELFSTPTNYAGGTVTATTTLSKGLIFSDPSADSSKDIIFTKISGTTTASTIVIVSEGSYATTTVSSIGAVY